MIYKESLRLKVQMEITCFLNAKVDELYNSGALTHGECEERLRSRRSSTGAPFEMGASTSTGVNTSTKTAGASTCTNPRTHGFIGPTTGTSAGVTTAVGLVTSSCPNILRRTHVSMGPTEVKILDEQRFNVKPSKSKILEEAMEGMFDSDD